ncbi:MAG: NAD-dependent malic enzyme [Bradyrhizobiaceae bacterium]|nr:NAD-dependent malic enzyme [Bradyrhizobiaceae bacterium]
MKTNHPSGKSGMDLLRDPRWNKGTAFTREEREAYGILGLLPDIVSTPETQTKRIEAHIASLPRDIDKYIYLADLQERNLTIYYRILMGDPVTYMPIVYTPTVGEACQTFGRNYRRPQGIYITLRHRGKMKQVLRNWPEPNVQFITVTDGERILGLGDLGAQGMGIPIGKLALYTAVAGVPPHLTLPIALDVGTNNEELLNDPLYIGLAQNRIVGTEYDNFIDEFVESVKDVFPGCTIQWEDFANHHAAEILEQYRHRVCSFNDDIQGTAGVGVSGIMTATRCKGERLQDQTYLFFGAGSAGIGIADLLCTAMEREGLTREEAQHRCWLVDSKGLVTSSRTDLTPAKLRYANKPGETLSLEDAVRELGVTVLLGTSTIPGSFTQPIIEQMARNTERPIIFPYSNPTSKSECTAEQAYTWSGGKAIFASGSPFPPFEYDGKTLTPSQGNNVYIFPAMGLAVLAAKPTTIPDEAFSVAARALSGMVTQEMFDSGVVYPPLTRIRESAHVVATAVAEYFFDSGLATVERPADVGAFVADKSYKPDY